MKKTGRKKGCIPWNKGIPRTDEEKKKISLSTMGRTINENQRRGLEKGWLSNVGRKHSLETRKKLSVAMMGKMSGEKNPNWKGGLPKCKYCNVKLSQYDYVMCIDCYLKKEVGKKLKGKSFSEEHRKNLGISRKNSPNTPRGENHPSWKGGVTPEHEKIRKSTDYKLWRIACFERDNYTCQGCGKHGGNLEVHHLKPFSTNPDQRLKIENGITYCIDCHKQKDFWRK